MINRKPKTSFSDLDHDEVYCPITRLVMRHPIRVSSGYVYELQALITHIQTMGKTCPVTNQPITSAEYAQDIKTLIDGSAEVNENERYDEYRPGEVDNLKSKLNTILHPYKFIPTSLMIGLGCALYFYCTFSLFNQQESLATNAEVMNVSVVIAIVAAVGDFLCRLKTNNRSGLLKSAFEFFEEARHRLANEGPPGDDVVHQEINRMIRDQL